MASASASSVSWSATMTETFSSASATAAGLRAASRSAPGVGRLGGAQGLAHERRPRGERAGGRAQRANLVPPHADEPDQPAEQRLRVAREPLLVAVARADHVPGAVVEMRVEAGQHDRAPIRPGDGGDQPGGGAVGAGRARDDRRAPPDPRAAVESGDLGLDQGAHAGRSIDEAVLGEPLRPDVEGDLEEVERDAPVAVVRRVRREVMERPGVDPLDDHVVDQRGEVAGERISLGRRRGHEGRLLRVEFESVRVGAADRAAQRLAPGADEQRQRVPSGQGSDRRRRPGARDIVRHGIGEGRGVVGLEGAERRDPRQKDAVAAARREQGVRQRRGRALGRHVDRRLRERQRPIRPRKTFDDFAVEQGAAQRRQERSAGRNGEDAGRANRHPVLSRHGRAKTRFGSKSLWEICSEPERATMQLT